MTGRWGERATRGKGVEETEFQINKLTNHELTNLQFQKKNLTSYF